MELQAEISKCQTVLSDLLKPELTDPNHIETLYNWYGDLATGTRTEQRQKFIFIVLMLYRPDALLSGMPRNGLRRLIAEVIGIHPDLISQYGPKLMFYYFNYSLFRTDVDYLYDTLLNQCKLNGLE